MTLYDDCGYPISAERRARWRRNGARLRAMREAAGITIPELATAHGMNACDWQLAELGVRDLDVSQLVQAAPILGVSAADVLAGWAE